MLDNDQGHSKSERDHRCEWSRDTELRRDNMATHWLWDPIQEQDKVGQKKDVLHSTRETWGGADEHPVDLTAARCTSCSQHVHGPPARLEKEDSKDATNGEYTGVPDNLELWLAL